MAGQAAPAGGRRPRATTGHRPAACGVRSRNTKRPAAAGSPGRPRPGGPYERPGQQPFAQRVRVARQVGSGDRRGGGMRRYRCGLGASFPASGSRLAGMSSGVLKPFFLSRARCLRPLPAVTGGGAARNRAISDARLPVFPSPEFHVRTRGTTEDSLEKAGLPAAPGGPGTAGAPAGHAPPPPAPPTRPCSGGRRRVGFASLGTRSFTVSRPASPPGGGSRPRPACVPSRPGRARPGRGAHLGAPHLRSDQVFVTRPVRPQPPPAGAVDDRPIGVRFHPAARLEQIADSWKQPGA